MSKSVSPLRTTARRLARMAVVVLLTGATAAACVPIQYNPDGPVFGYQPAPPPVVDPAPTPEPPPPPRVERRTFNEPRIGGRWLDRCFARRDCREQQTVNTFCRQQGYDRSIGHQSRMTPPLQTNFRIGDQSVCRHAVGICHRVTTVTCERTS